ncbi:hypothetical protein LR48_Vigan07g214500 [Vigna angularis]|uniref:Uncharacterized protein n=1 Tax=Phaseolus angularis TaxID=3914 RepID=A0A0L9V0I3_PHAAN|nr:hypothetical protein LR48_Vigan07g214500 [Vigna angularis]
MNTSNHEELEEIQNCDNDDIENAELEEPEGQSSMASWKSQITIRGLITSFFIGIIYSVIVMKLNLSTGLVPNLNVSAALLGFVLVRIWTMLLEKANVVTTPFTRQENTIIQTCAVACYSTSFGGGFGSHLLGLNRKTYEQVGVDTPGNTPITKEPGIGWMTAFLFVTYFVGLAILVPLRKLMIIDYKLSYPSGTATAVLINGFHAPKGDEMAKKQVHGFMKFFSFSFLWSFFQWFYAGGVQCGFVQFPTFGLKAWKNSGLKGQWFPESLPESSMKSLNGYRVFISIALILGDGLYNFAKILLFTATNIHATMERRSKKSHNQGPDDLKRNQVFVRESIPMWLALSGYILLAAISIIAIPFIFPEVKWYYVVVAYILAPTLSFCNAYGAGLTDMNMAYNYGKVALFVLSALGGKRHGVVAGLVGCGVIKSLVSTSSDLMQDFKTGHLTFTSPRSMLVGQAIGTAIGCVVAPLTFFLFYKAFDVGNPDGEYKAPYAIIYRNMAILGVEGFSALPHHCLHLCCGFFAFSVAANLVRDFNPKNIGRWIPLPMAMAVPFVVGGYFAIDMCVGSLIVYAWHILKTKEATLMLPAIASGLICGDGLWILPSSILALFKVRPPICMRFLERA